MTLPVEIIEAVERLELARDDIELLAAYVNEAQIDALASTASNRLNDLIEAVVNELTDRTLGRAKVSA